MQIRFRIDCDSEAVFTDATLRNFREAPDVIALDWLKDIIFEAEKLYDELHPLVFRQGTVQ